MLKKNYNIINILYSINETVERETLFMACYSLKTTYAFCTVTVIGL